MVSAACSVLLCLSYSVCNAQVDATSQVTGNIITNNWQGTTPISGYGGLSGGYQPGYISNQQSIVFGYSQGTASQQIAIDAALSAAGTGVELKGYNYSWYYYNNDMNRGNLSGTISLKGSAGNVLESYNYTMPQTGIGNWIQQSGTQLFSNQYQINQVSTLDVSFTGKDDRFWAGYYGPAIKAIDIRLMYGVNPCATNPAYSPTCAGFDKILETTNQVPNPDSYAYGGYSINNSFAINKAFEAAGTGLQIHGFKWGYVANANGPYCGSWDLGIFGCLDPRNPYVSTNVNITNSSGASLYNVSRLYQNSYNTTSYQYLFPTSQQLGSLGSFNFTASTNDKGYIGSMWSKVIYTPDQCILNPLSSPTCPGYAKAMALQSTTTGGTTTTETVTTLDTTSPTVTIIEPVQTVATSPTSSSTTSSSVSPTSSGTSTVADVSQPVSSSPATSSSSSSSSTSPTSTNIVSASTTVTPTANNPQPKVGEVSTAGSQTSSSKSSSTVSTSQILSIVGGEQSRLNKLETSTAQAAVEQAKSESAKVTADAQQVAATQQAQTISNAQAVISSVTPSGQASSQTFTSLQATSGPGLNIFTAPGVGIGINLMRGPDQYSLASSGQTINYGQTTSTNSIATAAIRRDREDNRSFEQNSSFEQRQSLSATNPLAGVINPPPMIMPQPPAPTGPSVNKNAKDNDAAGGMSIAAIAKQPQGFELYMSGLQDRAFYAPKEIYRGQRVVDNARAQRMLSGASDRLHQEMMEQQYKLGN